MEEECTIYLYLTISKLDSLGKFIIRNAVARGLPIEATKEGEGWMMDDGGGKSDKEGKRG